MPKEIYESDPISVPEVRKILLDRAMEGEDLSYMQRIALEHAQLTSRISSDVAKKLVDDLVKTFSMTKKSAITLANFIPNNIEELKVLLGKEAGNYEQESFDKMLEKLNGLKLLTIDQIEKELKEIDDERAKSENENKEIDESMIPEDLR
jgi:DNA-directed RNA polymerase subunit F